MKLWQVILCGLVGVGFVVYMEILQVPYPGELEQNSYKVFEYINQERQAQGIPALIWDKELAQEATNHSQYMAKTRDYRHSDLPFAETIMVGHDPKLVSNAWLGSPAHYQIITDRSLTKAGVGMAVELFQLSGLGVTITIGTTEGYSTFMAQ